MNSLHVEKRKAAAAVLAILVLGLPFLISPVFSQTSTHSQFGSVAASGVNTPYSIRFQNKLFYAAGRYWLFYNLENPASSMNTGLVYYVSSLDSVSWSAPVEVGVSRYHYGEALATFFDGAHVSVVVKAFTSGMDDQGLFYRRGAPQGDGSIVWDSQDWQLIMSFNNLSSGGGGMADHYLAVDSAGCPVVSWWVTAQLLVSISDSNSGAWVTAPGYPVKISAGYMISAISALLDRRMYVVFTYSGYPVMGSFYDGYGSAWSPAEQVSTSPINAELGGESWSFSVSESDSGDVHLVFLTNNNPKRIVYLSRSYASSSWSSETVLQEGVAADASPVLCVDKATGNLVVFWQSRNHIYYRARVDGVWDEAATDWINEETEHLAVGIGAPGNDTLNCFRYSMNGEAGLAYLTGAQAPYTLKFAALKFPGTPGSGGGNGTDPVTVISENPKACIIIVLAVAVSIAVIVIFTRKGSRSSRRRGRRH